MTNNNPKTTPKTEEMSGTHPAAILGLAAGILSIFFGGGCSLLDPRLGTLNHSVLGLISVVCALLIWNKVKRGELDESNLFQARLALALGSASLLIAVAWTFWIVEHPLGY